MNLACRIQSAAVLVAVLFMAEAMAQSHLGNISTRGQVLTGNDVMIAGFVIQGTRQTVVVRARGPSLVPFGIANPLEDPTIQLVRSSDQAPIASNDDWENSANAGALGASGFAPSHPYESALLVSLDPGAYTAIVSGFGGGTGVAIVEVFAVADALPTGVYTGSSNAGNTVLGMITSSGRYFFLHSPPAVPSAVLGVDTATTASAGGGSFTSSTEMSIAPFSYIANSGSINHASATTLIGNFTASYNAGASFGGTFTYLPSGSTTVTTSFVPGSNLPATLAAFPAAYSGRISYANLSGGHSRFDWAPLVSLNVSAQGEISGNVTCETFPVVPPPGPPPSCAIAGTLTPRTDMNAYDVSVSFVEISNAHVRAQFAGKTFQGLAYLNAGTNRLTFVAVGPDNPSNIFVFSN